jgi:hypothetical protein
MRSLGDLEGRATITIPEAGELLGGLGRSAAYEAARRGEIPTLSLGRKRLVPVPALMRLLGADPVTNGDHEGVTAQVGGGRPDSLTGGPRPLEQRRG